MGEGKGKPTSPVHANDTRPIKVSLYCTFTVRQAEILNSLLRICCPFARIRAN